MVWGGDAKVALFAPLPLRNGGKSIWFGDRFSFSTISGAALDKLDEPALRALAKKLHNDVFVFDQMACSSPHALYVVGEAEAHWPAVKRLLDASALEWTMDDPKARVGHAIGKMTAAFYAAATGRASSVNWRDTNLTSVVASAPERQEIRVGGGFLSVVFIPSLAEVARLHPRERPDDHLFRLGARRDRSGRRVPRGAWRLALGADRDGARLRFHLGRLRHPVRTDAARPHLLNEPRLLPQNQHVPALLDADQGLESFANTQLNTALRPPVYCAFSSSATQLHFFSNISRCLRQSTC